MFTSISLNFTFYANWCNLASFAKTYHSRRAQTGFCRFLRAFSGVFHRRKWCQILDPGNPDFWTPGSGNPDPRSGYPGSGPRDLKIRTSRIWTSKIWTPGSEIWGSEDPRSLDPRDPEGINPSGNGPPKISRSAYPGFQYLSSGTGSTNTYTSSYSSG